MQHFKTHINQTFDPDLHFPPRSDKSFSRGYDTNRNWKAAMFNIGLTSRYWKSLLMDCSTSLPNAYCDSVGPGNWGSEVGAVGGPPSTPSSPSPIKKLVVGVACIGIHIFISKITGAALRTEDILYNVHKLHVFNYMSMKNKHELYRTQKKNSGILGNANTRQT